MLRELIGLQEAQIELIRTLDLKVDALLQGPFNTGCEKLRDAVWEGRDPEDRERLLREARTSFYGALGQEREPLRRSFAALHLAGVWLALGSPTDVRRRLEEAHLEALQAVRAEGLRRSRGLRGLTQWFESESTLQLTNRERQARIALYANRLALTRRAWGTSAADAPVFVGYSFESAEERVQAEIAMRVRTNLMREELAARGLGEWAQIDPDHGGDTDPVRESMRVQALRGELRMDDELPGWLDARSR